MRKWFCRHNYKSITPSFMHLYVAKEIGETPSAVPMAAGRECLKCGKRHAVFLHETVPDLIRKRVVAWSEHELDSIEHGEQLLSFLTPSKTILIKDLEAFMIATFLESAGMTGIVMVTPDTDLDALREKKSALQLVVNNQNQ